jgi:hypothetical protein
VLVGIDVVGIWFGPFPTILCDFINISKGTITWTFIFTLFNIFIINFMFVCVWKKMRMMNDFLLFHLISRISVMIAFCMAITKSLAPGKPTLNIVSIVRNQLNYCSKLDIYPNYLWPHLIHFVFPLFFAICIATKIFFKRIHEKKILKPHIT